MELVRLKDEEFWSIFVRVVVVCKYKLFFDIVEVLNEGEILSIYYYRKCCSVFIMKKFLEIILK